MIFHPVNKLTAAGIDEILIVTGVDHMGDVVNLLGSGKDYGCRFTYKVQDQAGGIAQALGLAENFAGDDRLCVILGDNVFEDDIGPFVERFDRQRRGARIVLKQVSDPTRFGVAEVKNGKILGIEEKPKKPRSDLAVTGIYFYDSGVFDFIRHLKPSGRGELEITDVNNGYLKAGKLQFDAFEGWWTDAGTFDSLQLANELVSKVEGSAKRTKARAAG
jgi:glucose-1-phosphate thymidylyltransferase